MLYGILDNNQNIISKTNRPPWEMIINFPNKNYVILNVTPYEYKHELLGVSALMSINRVIKGLPAKNGLLAPSPELASDVEIAWRWGEEISSLELSSPTSLALHSLLVAAECITQAEMNKLIVGESIIQ